MKKLIVANWKMAPATWGEAQEILEFANDHLESLSETRELSVVFCPPFVFIEEAARLLGESHLEHEAFLGAQDISPQDTGALTGEVSGPMLAKLGVRYVIVGHSERRWKLGESDETVRAKLEAVLRNEMIPIVCLGETEREGDWMEFLRRQAERAFAGLPSGQVSRCVVAYEPVWAISTNPNARPDTPASAIEAMSVIRSALRSISGQEGNIMLYGGSVNAANAHDFIKEPDINGVLVGGASVRKEEFVKILSAAGDESRS